MSYFDMYYTILNFFFGLLFPEDSTDHVFCFNRTAHANAIRPLPTFGQIFEAIGFFCLFTVFFVILYIALHYLDSTHVQTEHL